MRAIKYECRDGAAVELVEGEDDQSGDLLRIHCGAISILVTQDGANDIAAALIKALEDAGGVTTLFDVGYTRDLSY